jgi:hypothetical protein
MESTTPTRKKRATLRSWIIVVVMAFAFLMWGLVILFTVGDKGSPTWDFGTVEDIPGESPYSTQKP